MRKTFKPAILAAVIAAAAAGSALADDNGMTPGYGDSWAALQAQNPQAATTPPYTYQQNGVDMRSTWSNARARWNNTWHRMTGRTTTDTNVVTTPSDTVVATPQGGAVVTPSTGVATAPAPNGVIVEPSGVASRPLDPAVSDTRPMPETELNTGHYIDSNGNPVVPPANARPAP